MKKEETPARRASRNYEERHKEERRLATGQFNTRLPRKDFEEINAFLEEHHVGKIELIYAGYEALKEQYGKKDYNRR